MVLTVEGQSHTAEVRVSRLQFIFSVIVILVWTVTVYTAGTVKANKYISVCKSTPWRTEKNGQDVIVCVIVEESKSDD